MEGKIYKILTFEDLKERLLNKRYLFEDLIFDDNLYEILEDKPDIIHLGDLIEIIVDKNSLNDIPIPLKFKNCIFEIDIGFKFNKIENVTIERMVDCKFKKSCTFINIQFTHQLQSKEQNKFSDTTFSNVQFEQLYFDRITFNKSNLFNEVEIFDDMVFSKCQFVDAVSLSNLKFEGRLIVTDCLFESDCKTNIPFQKDVILRNSEFKKDLTIWNEIYGIFHIVNVTIGGLFSFFPSIMSEKNMLFDTVSPREAYFGSLLLGKNILFKNIDLSKYSFLYSTFSDAQFTKCYLSQEKIYDELQFEKPDSSTSSEYVINELRMFEMSFDNRKNFIEAGKFHVKALELTRKTEKNFIKKILLWSYKVSSDYGENFVKCLVLILLTLLFFSLIYPITGISYAGYHIWWWDCAKPWLFTDWGSGLIYSLISSSPIRRDTEIVKSLGGWTVGISIAQTIIQTILGTLFIIGIRRKFKR